MRFEWLRFHPRLAGARSSDRLAASLGALAAILIVALTSAALLASLTPIWLVAPIGASAVLVFAVPASPLAQPWPVIGGNILSALVGVVVANTAASHELAAALAVGLAIAVMSIARCLHPPGGAAALTAVIGGPAVHALGWSFPFVAVGLNSIILVAAGIAFHRISGHSYPHRAVLASGDLQSIDRRSLDADDIEAVLAELGESFDIGIDDLATIVHAVERRAEARDRLGSKGMLLTPHIRRAA
ncbi:MAG: HPP family protein [Sphingopyxis sp.]|uniref:HPP family protein n=1 Tax=Sphingopyxis sp. TaxID=1908224 RepID=UPI003D80B3C0